MLQNILTIALVLNLLLGYSATRVLHGPPNLVQKNVAKVATLVELEIYLAEVYVDEAFDVGLWSKPEKNIFYEKNLPLII